MDTELFIAESDAELNACFPVFSALRPHLRPEEFVSQVRRQQAQSYRVLALRQNQHVKSVAGFRMAEFLVWGKVLYIDDLGTLPTETSKGFAGQLMDWLIEHAKYNQCKAVHLDTGYARHAAHRLYLRKGLKFSCHHLELNLT